MQGGQQQRLCIHRAGGWAGSTEGVLGACTALRIAETPCLHVLQTWTALPRWYFWARLPPSSLTSTVPWLMESTLKTNAVCLVTSK